MPLITLAEIPYIQVQNRNADPSGNPASGYAWIYTKNNANYIKNSSGTVIGPISSSVGALDDLSDVAITSAAKGDIIARTTTGFVNLAVGTDDQVLVADSSAPEGVSWQDSAAASDNDAQILAWLGMSGTN